MKTRIFISLVLICSGLILSFSNLRSVKTGKEVLLSSVPGGDNQFLIAATHSALDTSYQHYPDLGVNGWHKYTAPDRGWPNIPNDQYNVPTAQYSGAVISRMDRNRQNGLRTIMDRPKIQYTAYGQRSDYHCEAIGIGDDYWFHSYNTSVNNAYVRDINDNSIYGSGARVKYCEATPSNPGSNQGYIVQGLRANREQANKLWPPWLNDDTYKWYVMPRIRIDTSFANNNLNWNTQVCRIEVYNWDDSLILSKDILAGYFRKGLLTNYYGHFMEEYYFSSGDSSSIELPANAICPGGYRWFSDWNNDTIKTDIRVYWYGMCDMWIDYVRVENEPAHELFKGLWDPQIREETQLALYGYDENNPIPNNFYAEEFEFNMIPCISYVNSLIEDESQGKISLMPNLNCELIKVHIPDWNVAGSRRDLSAAELDRYLVERADLNYLVNMSYSLEGFESTSTWTEGSSYHPTSLSASSYSKSNGILSYPRTVSAYEDSLQNRLDFGRGTGGSFSAIMKKTDSISKLSPDLRLIHLAQTHMWWNSNHQLKEPTNEETSLMANLAVSYGAKGIMYFAYDSHGEYTNTVEFTRGLTNPDLSPRTANVYGQDKWNGIKKLDSILNKQGVQLVEFDNSGRMSYSYRQIDERNLLTTNTIVKGLNAFRAFEFAPDTIPDLINAIPDQTSELYLQAAVFEKPNQGNDRSKYFMIVNKRCSPFFDYTSSDRIGGRRIVTIKWNSSKLEGFNNWKLYDLSNDSCIKVLDKRDTNFMFLADFLPGEGKLYKLAPVMQEGGTLVADEDCGGFEFECKGEVNNNGHDITIVPNTTIVFVNTSARINMNGGNFKSGIYPDESLPITLKSVGTATWKGLKLTGCDEVEMHQTYFENISSYPVDSTYAAEFTDCGSITVSNCTFQASSTSRTGSLLLSYSSQADPDDVYIFSNHFKLNTGSLPAVSVIATGYVGIPVLFEWNEFESSSENNTLAILLSNVTGGAIKENNFTGYDNTVMMLGSSVDFYGNYILGSEQSSKGIIQYSTSSANLSPSGGIFTGGYNTILVEGSLAACMQFSNSFLLIDQGYNIFRLAGSETGNWQLEGIILDEVYGNPYPAERNCFKIGNDLIVKHNLKYPDYATVVLDTLPGSCDPDEPEGLMVFDLGNGVSDTIHYLSGGSSSGAGKSNSKLKIRNYKYEEAAEAGSVSEAVAIRALSDSVSINLRKRDYERVSELCNELLTTHSDSVEDASLISKLYLAELKQDTSSSGMSELKSFLESYILNNPEREIMIRQAFYFVQKCKVSLGLYESAMSGFQQIINQFPYSYEGLLASWDYAATSLLNSQGGSGGGATSKNEPALKDEGVISYIDDPNDVYDSRKFSTDDRKTLNENLTKTFSSQVNKQTREIKSLEEKVTKNEASNSEKKRYQEMKVLKEVVKARKPETIAMHVSMISDDMSRIMKSTGGENSDKYEANILPTRFALHPNYPNPFNPATKISFDLPQDSRVSLVIYDLLGREVTRLVNNEFKVAGRYEYEFNASGLASGVYFYRLEARKFSETKRMALIK